MTSNGREHKWELFEIHFYVKCSLHIIQHLNEHSATETNINHLLRFSTMYQHQIYIGTNVTPAFLFYIKRPEAFVSLWSEAEFPKAHSSINII